MPTSILTGFGGALASGVVNTLFNKKDKAPAAAAPKVETPTLMPDPMAQKAQERRKAAISLSRQLNAADTVLTGDNNTLGG